MKIRTGFVSNSSSSSFCGFGISRSKEDLKKSPNFQCDVDGYIDFYADLEKMLKGTNLTYSSLGSEGEYYAIARTPQSIKDDETGLQFKETTINKIAEIFYGAEKDSHIEEIRKECGWIEEGWYNG